MGKRQPRPDNQQEPVVTKVRVRYAKRGRLRFTSHRDFARALERAVRRAGIPIAYSSGFSPHPKISYASAAPTGVASEAEYVEFGLRAPMDAERLRAALDAALPPGLDILDAVEARVPDFADRVTGSRWRIALAGVRPDEARAAVAAFLAADEVLVERMTKHGRRTMDTRSPVAALSVTDGDQSIAPGAGSVGNTTADRTGDARGMPCAILDLVVRHVTPSVRPDDVLTGLHAVAALAPPVPPLVTRLAQGGLGPRSGPGSDGPDVGGSDPGSPDPGGPDDIVDPLAADREGAVTGTPST